jgi:cobalt/nickel transport system permease protein
MKDKILLLIYLILLVFISLLRSLDVLLISLVVLFLVYLILPLKINKIKSLKKVFFTVSLFSGIVTLPYFVAGFFMGENRWNYFFAINLRTFELAFLTVIFLSKINLFKALDFSKNLTMLLVLVSGFVVTYSKTLKDFQDAFNSRTIEKKVQIQELRNYIKRVVVFFFEKSKETSQETYLAMKSRGFYYDNT